MKRWPFVTLAILSFTASGMIAANEISNAASPVAPTVVVATMPPPPQHFGKLALPRNGLFEPDAVAQAEGVQSSPLPLPVLQQNEAQAWAATAISGVTAVSVAGDSAYAVVQTPSGSLIVRLGDVVDGRKVIGITDCDPPQPGCHAGVMFEGGIFEPVGVKPAAQIPAVGGALPMKAVPVQALSATPPPQTIMANSSTPQITPLPRPPSNILPYHTPVSGPQRPDIFATPTVINPANLSTPETPGPK